MRPIRSPRLSTLALAACLIGGCAVGPAHQRPTAAEPAAFKAERGWVAAAPADTLERGPWWTLFNDPILNDLAARVEVSNQNVASAVAAYAQARTLVAQQRASLFPVIGADARANRSGARGGESESRLRLDIRASWEPDIWGRLRAGVNGAQAGSGAGAADLAAARLSAQGELAANYFSLRQADAQRALLASTIEGYQRVSTITQNRYAAGIEGKTAVLQAQTQLAGARIDELALARQRAQYEHAIAVLLGKAPADFALAAGPWTGAVPAIPPMVPSTLLQRRPDVASAERRVAAANADIGIARAAYYPSLNLSGSIGNTASAVSGLFSASNALWSFGLGAAQTLFNAGATRARVAGAEAQHAVAVARYRQTVLDAFADVENALTATHTLAQQQVLRRQASEAADQVEAQMLNRYKAGQVGYTEVVQAQQTALSARRALVQSQAERQVTAVTLIQSLGGTWRATPQ
ncbi:efflux transporter outer membrane subunit [Massilia glaciei]|uniref:RND transporter n=1 Tax=Massilia glaciei TaxID=1524097 RepID=A0A2U2I5M4_9BURK|nr:efflux transporter outer membrane subunit [Massilia glaciei]PWF55061.1 RND transporter [Massilia glaciei]